MVGYRAVFVLRNPQIMSGITFKVFRSAIGYAFQASSAVRSAKIAESLNAATETITA